MKITVNKNFKIFILGWSASTFSQDLVNFFKGRMSPMEIVSWGVVDILLIAYWIHSIKQEKGE